MYARDAQVGDILDIARHWPDRITITSITPAGFLRGHPHVRLRWAAIMTSPGTAWIGRVEGQTLLPDRTLARLVLTPDRNGPIRKHPGLYARRLHCLAPSLLDLPTPFTFD